MSKLFASKRTTFGFWSMLWLFAVLILSIWSPEQPTLDVIMWGGVITTAIIGGVSGVDAIMAKQGNKKELNQ